MNVRDRLWQLLLILSTLAFSWMAMMVAHEAGHVLHLIVTGGSIEQITLHPLKLSQTLPEVNPDPLATVVGGPLWGILLPLMIWWIVVRLAPGRAYLAAFFAGFCLVANGAYLAGDAFLQGGDGRELVQHGVPPWALIAVGLPATVAGIYVWNGLGPQFGLGEADGRVSRTDAVATVVLAAAVALAEIVFASPGAG